MSLIHINPELANAARLLLKHGPPLGSEAVAWWQLITEAEEYRYRTGWGLAGIWGHIHRGEYDEARESLDRLTKGKRDV